MAGDVTRSLVSARIEFLCPTGSGRARCDARGSPFPVANPTCRRRVAWVSYHSALRDYILRVIYNLSDSSRLGTTTVLMSERPKGASEVLPVAGRCPPRRHFRSSGATRVHQARPGGPS
jgi:hypothetical protein